MKMSAKEYQNYVRRRAPRSKLGQDVFLAFLVGGAICALGQAIRELFGSCGIDEEQTATLTSVTLIFLGELLTGLGLYSKLARFAGAGTLVPITGFANSIAAPAIEFKTEKLVTGTSVRMFTIAGPVIVFGLSAGVVYGVIYFLATFL